jgi:hypothetical protein
MHRSKTYTNIDYAADDHQVLVVTAPAKKNNVKNKNIHKFASMIRSWTTNSMTSKRLSKVAPRFTPEFSESLEGNDHSVPKTLDLSHNNYTDEQDESPHCRRTPQLIESCSLESLTDEELTPYSSNNTTTTNLLIQTESAIPQDIDLCNEKSLSVIVSVNQKKAFHRNITTVFQKWKKSIEQTFRQKKTKIKSTISSFNLANKRKSASGRNSVKRTSEITETDVNQDGLNRTNNNNSTVKLEYQAGTNGKSNDEAQEIVNVDTEFPSLCESVTLVKNNLSAKPYFTYSFSFEDFLHKDNSYDRLYEAIKTQSLEYQEYFADEMKQDEEQLNGNDDENMGEYSQSPILPYQYHFSPPVTKKQGIMATSKTEGYIADAVPYVCVGSSVSPQHTDTSPTEPAESLKLDGFKKYTKSTSVFSNIKDYDMQWQNCFHKDQQDTDKIILTLRCISWDLYKRIQRNHENGTFQVASIFDQSRKGEDVISFYIPDEDPMTSPADIYDVMAHIFDCGNFTSEHAILAYIYIKRMVDYSNQSLWDFSWKYIVIAALFNAYKVWDDCAVFNADYVGLFPDFDIDYLNRMEIKFLELLNWQVTVKCSDFAQAYFHLRSLEKPAQAFK